MISPDFLSPIIVNFEDTPSEHHTPRGKVQIMPFSPYGEEPSDSDDYYEVPILDPIVETIQKNETATSPTKERQIQTVDTKGMGCFEMIFRRILN